MCNIVHFCCVYTRHDSDLTAGIENELDMTILLFCISRIKSPDTCSSISRAAYAMKIIYIYIYTYMVKIYMVKSIGILPFQLYPHLQK